MDGSVSETEIGDGVCVAEVSGTTGARFERTIRRRRGLNRELIEFRTMEKSPSGLCFEAIIPRARTHCLLRLAYLETGPSSVRTVRQSFRTNVRGGSVHLAINLGLAETFCGNGAVGVPSGSSYWPCSSRKPIGFLRRAAAMIWMSVKTTGTKRGRVSVALHVFLGGFSGAVVFAGAVFFFVDGVLATARFWSFAMGKIIIFQRRWTRGPINHSCRLARAANFPEPDFLGVSW